MRSALYCATLLFLVTCSYLHVAQGIFFYVEKTGQKCFFMELPGGEDLAVHYESPETTNEKRILMIFFGPRGADNAPVKPITEAFADTRGTFSISSVVAGEHWICLRFDTTTYEIPDERLRFSLKISQGMDEHDYSDMAKREHLDELELNIVKLKDRVAEILKREGYAENKNVALHSISTDNNSRVMWMSIIQMGVLFVSGYYQAIHLRSYFHKKKLV